MKRQKLILKQTQFFFKPNTIFYIFPATLIRDGKRSTAEKILSESFRQLKRAGIVNPQLALFEAIELLRIPVSPCRFKSRGQIIYLPRRLSWLQQYQLVGRWFRKLLYTRKRVNRPASTRLCGEVELLYGGLKRSQTWQEREVAIELLSKSRPISLAIKKSHI